jgi:hypothetical protein
MLQAVQEAVAASRRTGSSDGTYQFMHLSFTLLLLSRAALV